MLNAVALEAAILWHSGIPKPVFATIVKARKQATSIINGYVRFTYSGVYSRVLPQDPFVSLEYFAYFWWAWIQF